MKVETPLAARDFYARGGVVQGRGLCRADVLPNTRGRELIHKCFHSLGRDLQSLLDDLI